MAIHLAIDIGGTFTDVVVREGGSTEATKVPTTPQNLIHGVKNGIDSILDKADKRPEQVTRFVHGTTAGTNTVIEKDGGTVGLLMTEGFRDVLEIGRQKRSDLYDLFNDPETPAFLAPREQRVGIEERMNENGEVITPLDEEQVLDAVGRLVEKHDINSVSVCYLFSFLNPEHEQRTKQLIEEHYPDLYVSLSSNINPKFREYERSVVTTFDAYLRPAIQKYVEELGGALEEEGIDVEFQIMKSRGGITSSKLIIEKPVSTVLSGPSAAVVGATSVGADSGYDDLITVDMGGTSCDISIIDDGSPHISNEGEILEYPLRIQMIDISTIGSGGGSIAWIDQTNRLNVGPKSAGADPGPVCYDKGGTEPTVTDAALVLGYLDPEDFADGTYDLNVQKAEEAIESKIAEPLGYDTIEAAKAINNLVNSKMSEQLRLDTVKRGFDPRRFVLFAMGGAGPLHASKLAMNLDVPHVLVPPSPGVLAASGLLSANVEHVHQRTFLQSLSGTDLGELNDAYDELIGRGEEAMEREGVPVDEVSVTQQADMRYQGQSFDIELEIPSQLDASSLSNLEEQFHRRHRDIYGHSNPDDPIEFVNLRLVSTYEPEKFSWSQRTEGTSLDDARKGTRETHFADDEDVYESAIYAREKLPLNETLSGPAVIEQKDSTTVVYPEQSCSVDEHGNLIIDT